MGREYKIDVVVDDHGAVEQIHRVADAEDRLVASGDKASGSVDIFTKRLKESRDVTAQHEQALRDGIRGWDTYTVSADEAAEVLRGMPTLFGGLRGGLSGAAEAAGLTVGQLGLLNAAGAVVGAGIAGWGIGRAIADFFGLDEKIATSTASLLGWGDVAAEQAGAKADALARASQIAGREITDLGEAMRINGQQVKDWSDAMARANGPREAALQIEGFRQELDKVRAAGVLPALTADINSGNFSLQKLAEWYRISAGAITFYKGELAASAAEQKSFDTYLKDREKVVSAALAAEEKAHKALADAKREVLTITTHINKEYDAEISKHDQIIQRLQTEASLSEFKAKEAVMAGFGLSANGTPLEQLNDPLVKATRALDELARAAQAGVSQENQKQLIYDQFIKETGEGTTVVVGRTAAERAAADAHGATRAAVDATTNALSSFRGVLVGAVDGLSSLAADVRNAAATVNGSTGMYTGDNLGMPTGSGVGMAGGALVTSRGAQHGLRSFDVGGPVWHDGPIFAHAGEIVVPKDGMLVQGGTGAPVVIYIDAKGATFENDRALDRLTDRIADRLGTRASQRGALR